MTITTLQLHKRSSYVFEQIQDKCAIHKNKTAFALADGTTQSYCSEIWSKILTENFANNPETDIELLIQNFQEAAQDYKNTKFAVSGNIAKASLEREKMKQGGTATFIGLVFLSETEVNISSCGDSNLFHLSNGQLKTFPFSDKDALDKNKSFLNTEKLLNNKIDASYFQAQKSTYAQGDIIIMATDALSRMFLKMPETLFEFLTLTNFDALHQFCLKYWAAHQLEEDDISAIIIDIDAQNLLNVIAPPAGFSFPKEEEYVFVPTSLDPPKKDDNGDYLNQKKINIQNMQEVKRELNNINQRIESLRQAQALQQILMFITIGLLVVVLLLVYMRTGGRTRELIQEIADLRVQVRNAKIEVPAEMEAAETAVKETEEWKYEVAIKAVDKAAAAVEQAKKDSAAAIIIQYLQKIQQKQNK
jgi:serine/threonine protein phosphatase PrpC